MLAKPFSDHASPLTPVLALALLVGVAAGRGSALAEEASGALSAATAEAAKKTLLEAHGEGETERISRGVDQVLRYWRPEDGDAEAFSTFVEAELIPEGEQLNLTFARFEFALERLGGYMTSTVRDLRRGVDLEIGPLLPLDRRLAGFNPAAHLADDLFANKIAFVALLNFPVTTLDERMASGMGWTRRQWAEARLAGGFASRVPAEAQQAVARVMAAADSYINGYNVYMHHLLTEDGRRLFPEGLRLISHWGLRDELKANYNAVDGLARQRMIARVFDRIVRQEIPEAVVDNPLLDWTPSTNAVAVSDVVDAEAPPDATAEASSEREPDERYRHWLEIFQAQRLVDAHSPENPTHIDRRFNEDREVPEEQVEKLFLTVLRSVEGQRVGRMVARRLGRHLEPHDIWYTGFKPGGGHSEASLDERTRSRYPTADAFAADIPRILRDLGFSAEQASMLASHVVVEPSRGAGHAFGGARRDDKAHLRTRVGSGGMDYKGYNIAVHELGHNIEQVFSVTTIDHTLLQGVPNTAFTEALAFVFQDRDLELLGMEAADPDAVHLKALDTFWNTREIAGVALVDMRAWRWLYEHPAATPAALREAVIGIAKGVWNEFFSPIFRVRDVTLLAVYSHMIDGAMYTPDYPLGHLISFQIEEHFRQTDKAFGEEFQRICELGSITPDAWMRQAVGSPLSAEPLIIAVEEAVAALEGKAPVSR